MLLFTVKMKRIILTVLCILTGAFLIALSEAVRNGVQNGLLLCVNAVIPSLFLFTALSLFVTKSGVAKAVGRILEPLSKRLFKLNGEQMAVFVISLFSGYPVGAKLINELYEKGSVSRKKALFMLGFCVNAGPAFIVVSVGQTVLGSKPDGTRLLAACLLSTCVLAFISSRFFKDEPQGVYETNQKGQNTNLAQAFVTAVSDAALTMFTVCAFVVVFSGITGVLSLRWVPEFIKETVLPLVEVTAGIGVSTRAPLGKTAFFIGFGGLSVQLQVMAAAEKIKPGFFRILILRAVHGLVAAGFIELFELISPRTVETVSFGQKTAGTSVHGNPLTAGAMLLLAVTVVLSAQAGLKKLKGENKTLEIE